MVFSLRNAFPKDNDTTAVYAGWVGGREVGGMALYKTCENSWFWISTKTESCKKCRVCRRLQNNGCGGQLKHFSNLLEQNGDVT